VQHGEEYRSLQRNAVLARTCQLLDDFATAGLLPQPLEQQRRPDASAGDLERRLLLRGRKHHRLGGKPRARSQQPLQLAARLQFLVTAERGDHLLANLVAVTPALDDLQIGAPG